MTIAVGDKIPDVELRRMGKREPETLRSLDVLGHGKVVVFGLPGAFTPTCSDFHLPGFIVGAEDLKAKGVDLIACVSVNDAYVMGAWGIAQGAGEAVMMLADGNGEFARGRSGSSRTRRRPGSGCARSATRWCSRTGSSRTSASRPSQGCR